MTIKNHIVMMGPPGSGKGTQAQILQARLGIPTYSVGEMLRRVSAEDTELGRKVKALIDKGSLVPDEVSSEIVLEEEGLSLDVVLLLEVPDNFIEERIIGRYACARCGSMYHGKFNPPKAGDACDVCGGKEFVRRADDNLETVQKRLEIYRAVTMPVIIRIPARLCLSYCFHLRGKSLVHRLSVRRGLKKELMLYHLS